ncbi:MAG: 30S ribosomal protein S4 [Candidatus Nealsonbacteria bacterium]|nr:30S ribosomal protein S4 [Candidatus Nealsonbacteria bacterium]
MAKSTCANCRRAGIKLFLKGEKCMSPKCPVVLKPYPPGQKSKRRIAPLSEYGKELKEKQKIKKWYNLGEQQFRNYVKDILKKGAKVQDAPALLIQKLETRLDNAVLRLGFATSHVQARQLVTHGHFLVNKKMVNIPSYQLKKGDVVGLHPSSSVNTPKEHQAPSWLKLHIDRKEGEVVSLPTVQDVSLPVEISSVFEFYSR